MDLNDPRLTDLAFKVLPTAKEIARELAKEAACEADVVRMVSERLKILESGLSPELEFIAAVNWLGRTRAISRIDQTPLPRCNDTLPELKVPDVLCEIALNEKTLPLLIEVKRSNEGKLVWSEKYITGLRRYAEAMQVPLLVAWKREHIWTLVDVSHFEKRVASYHLEFKKALTENLMSFVFGDCLVSLTQRISFYLDGEIKGLSFPLPRPPNLLPEGHHTITILGAGFLLDGIPIVLPSELTWLFFRVQDESVVEVTGDKTIRTKHTPTAETAFSLTDFALMLLLWGEPEKPDWDKVLRKAIPITLSSTREALRKGIDLGVIQYVLEQVPVTIPSFTQSEGRRARIQRRAYEIYERRQPNSTTPEADWLQAEAEIDGTFRNVN
jgi:Holliday junction resolvase